MTTLVDNLASERMKGGPFAAAFVIGVAIGTAAALVFSPLL
jgi:hypothetical protein